MRFYQEANGDYLVIDPSTRDYYRAIGQLGTYEGRATAIAGSVSSVCTTGIHHDFLRECRRVAKKNVPKQWLNMLVGEGDI